MNLFRVVVVAPLWAGWSTFFVCQACVSIIYLSISMVGFVRGKVERKLSAKVIARSSLQVILFTGLLFLGNYLLKVVFKLGETPTENAVYWLFFLLTLPILLVQVPAKIKRHWELANVPGKYTWQRKRRN